MLHINILPEISWPVYGRYFTKKIDFELFCFLFYSLSKMIQQIVSVGHAGRSWHTVWINWWIRLDKIFRRVLCQQVCDISSIQYGLLQHNSHYKNRWVVHWIQTINTIKILKESIWIYRCKLLFYGQFLCTQSCKMFRTSEHSCYFWARNIFLAYRFTVFSWYSTTRRHAEWNYFPLGCPSETKMSDTSDVQLIS